MNNLKQSKGITLIALIITIIVLLILAGVVINMTLGSNGLIEKTQVSVQKYSKAAAEEKISLAIANSYDNSGRFSNDLLKENINKIEGLNERIDTIEYPLTVKVDGFQFVINENRKLTYDGLAEDTNINNEGLIGSISNINESGYSNIQLKGKISPTAEEETVTLGVHTIVYEGNMVLDGTNDYTSYGITYNSDDSTYSVGDKTTDVATSTVDAQYTVVLKVTGNLTINENIKLTACKSDDGYGGPKGMLIYCSGKIKNDGEILMTARGARAAGQNVYLWKNKDGSFEYIPKDGSDGGAQVSSVDSNWGVNGIKGSDGARRQTGGGGSGLAFEGDEGLTTVSGAGAKGTSYSGGSGGGGTNANRSGGTIYGDDAKPNGGAGGAGRGYRQKSSWANRWAGGGAGNPGGKAGYNDLGNENNGKGESGTGGLLIIYSNEIENNGRIESNGSKGGQADYASGGSSGGGSINIFYKKAFTSSGTITADGGEAETLSWTTSLKGGAGGNGSVSAGKISSDGRYLGELGDFIIDENNIVIVSNIENGGTKIIANEGNVIVKGPDYQIPIISRLAAYDINWQSADQSIVKVDKNGKLTMVGNGKTTVTATTTNKYGDTFTKELNVECSNTSRLYLYFYGNDFNSLTGGYSIQGYVGSSSYSLTNYNTYMRLNEPKDSRAVFMRENTAINFIGYKKVGIYHDHSGNSYHIFLSTVSNYNGNDTGSGDLGYNYYSDSSAANKLTEINIENNTASSAYLYIRQTHTGYVDIKELYLEK